eukprot:787646_1
MYNPIPPKLFKKKNFIEFVMQNNKYLIQSFAQYIYEYLTGYLCDIIIPESETPKIVECYKYTNPKESVTIEAEKEIIETLSTNNLYMIEWKTVSGTIRMYKAGFRCLGNNICLGYVRVQDCDEGDFITHAILIKSILSYYGCNIKNFSVLDLDIITGTCG